MRFFRAAMTGAAATAASFVNRLRENSKRRKSTIMVARPSLALSATLPTKPSHTTMSALPLKISLPSTLPTKLISPANAAARSKSPAFLMTSLPLIASSPILSRPTEGLSSPLRTDTSAAPITANCSRFSALQSTLAPISSTVVARPRALGICPAMAGRSIPSSVLSR